MTPHFPAARGREKLYRAIGERLGALSAPRVPMSRLFHSLVVCGAGLTLLDCGGRSVERDPSDEPSTSGEPTATGGSGGATSVGSSATGGNSIGGIRGLPLGGTTSTDSAGSTSTGGASTVVVPAGAQGRWTCTTELTGCTSGTHEGYPVQGFMISKPCQPDMTRPASGADCETNQSFDCVVGFFGDETVLFNCECTSPTQGEKCHCPTAHAGCSAARNVHYCDGQQTVCGCAMTCIAK